jgi:hypothetical protein
VKWFTVFTVTDGTGRLENAIFRLHGIVVLGNSVGNNTRHASVDLGFHAQPGGLLFMGAW